MCCFSGPVRNVGGTRIFARGEGRRRQLLAYAMNVTLDAEVAMVLPLPMPPRPAEDAVATFDHVLTCQATGLLDTMIDRQRSTATLGRFVDADRARGLIDGALGGFTHPLVGNLPNASRSKSSATPSSRRRSRSASPARPTTTGSATSARR